MKRLTKRQSYWLRVYSGRVLRLNREMTEAKKRGEFEEWKIFCEKRDTYASCLVALCDLLELQFVRYCEAIIFTTLGDAEVLTVNFDDEVGKKAGDKLFDCGC